MIAKSEQHGDYTFVTVSDTGVSHVIHGVTNQDAAMFIIENEDFAMAVSDGVGSCAKADVGSQAAVTSVKLAFYSVKEAQNDHDCSRLPEKIIAEWKRLLGGMKADECCATLKAVMKFGNKIVLFSIGDGILAVTSRGMQCCAPIDTNLFANQTMCLNKGVKADDFWTSEFRLDMYVPYVIFACTDGVANGIQEGKELELVASIETETSEDELQKELETLVIDISEFSSDDRTVGVVKYERKNAKPDW
ncbi:protein phosphatase 2C domain-containing protein [Selenomonas sp. AB3002]|uniref:protein phosphatase 2C domain-containing protein n=1 Tax=Selenomonas sp. AB3002 TaxID=1392502 RepID=UPI0004964E01